MSPRENTDRGSLVSSIFKIYFFLVIHSIFSPPKECSGTRNTSEEVADMENKLFIEILNNSINTTENSSLTTNEVPTVTNSKFCKYFNSSNSLICKGAIDFAYLKSLQEKPITDFVVENYEAESTYMKKYWSSSTLKTGEWYTKLPRLYQKLTGGLKLQDTGMQIEVVLRLIPRKDSKDFIIDGAAFSNKVIKISWTLLGRLSLDFVQNRTVVRINLKGRDWSLGSNLTFVKRSPNLDVDEWSVFGLIKSPYLSENQYVIYRGTIGTRMKKGECGFSGEVNMSNVNLVGFLSGTVGPPQNKQITIPKSAFSKLHVKNVIFKDSVFFNDFDKNSFEGFCGQVLSRKELRKPKSLVLYQLGLNHCILSILLEDLNGVRSIQFIGSKLEVMPRLAELFKSFSQLEEIHFEDCVTPNLKFGSQSTLRNVQSFSFKGSGPLLLDDTSFVWLKNSSLKFLNLQNSHIIISSKASSILWSVSGTLKNLDISFSTLNEERDLTILLKELNITDLKAEGLNLRKIPSNSLAGVRKSLKFLSLRGNNFKKIWEKYMFDNIFNFPLMPELTELNLMECHINFIEKGAFDNLPNLKVLHIGYNHLENLQDGWNFVKPQVAHLDVTNNGWFSLLPSLPTNDIGAVMNLSKFEKIEVLNLSNGIFTNIYKLIDSVQSNVKNLSLKSTGLEYLPENIFDRLTNLETLDLSHNRDVKSIESFSLRLFKNLKKLRFLGLRDCRISISVINNDEFQTKNSEQIILESLEYLDLGGNIINVLESEKLKMLPKLRVLNLSGNSLTVWKTRLFSFNKYLETVLLNENKIDAITPEMFSDLQRLKYVKLGNNPFICGPYVYEILKISRAQNAHDNLHSFSDVVLKSFAMQNKTLAENSHTTQYDFVEKIIPALKQENYMMRSNCVYILDWSDSNYVCFSWAQVRFIPFSLVNETFDEVQILPFERDGITVWLPFIAVVGIVVSLIIVAVKWLDVHLITRAVRNAVALSFLARDEKDHSKYMYNIFVSYSDKDRSWVIDEMLPRLESENEVKVCLHERDFQVGLSIMENIISSIDSSKNIILVLSNAFLKSQWCQYEMHLAQHRLFENGRDQLILILLEQIPALKRPKTLRYLMMTKTYLEWPANPRSRKEVEEFWRRLKKSLLKL